MFFQTIILVARSQNLQRGDIISTLSWLKCTGNREGLPGASAGGKRPTKRNICPVRVTRCADGE